MVGSHSMSRDEGRTSSASPSTFGGRPSTELLHGFPGMARTMPFLTELRNFFLFNVFYKDVTPYGV
jgi:hypothetical protein